MADVTPLARAAEVSSRRSPAGRSRRGEAAVSADEALATLDAEGKVQFPCEIELFDGEGNRVATATVQWHVRLKQPAPADA